jgi:hypothetical protein
MIHLLQGSDEERRRRYIHLAEAADVHALKFMGSIREAYLELAKGWRGLAVTLKPGGR